MLQITSNCWFLYLNTTDFQLDFFFFLWWNPELLLVIYEVKSVTRFYIKVTENVQSNVRQKCMWNEVVMILKNIKDMALIIIYYHNPIRKSFWPWMAFLKWRQWQPIIDQCYIDLEIWPISIIVYKQKPFEDEVMLLILKCVSY